MKKIKVYHFNNGGGGGVLSVIKNLLKFSSHPLIENHLIYTINKDLVKEYKINHIEGAASETVFYYSPRWNFYHTCKQLSKLLPDENALIIAHDWLELGMASNLGLPNKVIQVVHGDYDYYYSLATLHATAIDAYIAVAMSIKDKLVSLLPGRKEAINCLHFPVPEAVCTSGAKDIDSIVFVGRCTGDKGYHLLPSIAASLSAISINLQWHIVGEPAAGDNYPWPANTNVVFHGLLSNEAVNRLLCRMEYFILPSLKEGMPVSLIESMKAGVIPVMNHLPGGVQELIREGETGYLSANNTVDEYVQIIRSLVANKDKVTMQQQCRNLANQLFNPLINTTRYESFYEKLAAEPVSAKPAKKVYGSRLDKKWLPNLITRSIRSL